MSLRADTLTEVAEEAAALFGRIRELGDAGRTDKTEEIERRALAMVSKLEAALATTSAFGRTTTPAVRRALAAQRRALEERLALPGLGLSEEMAVLAQLADLDFKLFAMDVERTLTWDRLLSTDELERYRRALREAADQLRRRRRLGSVVRSIAALLTLSLGLLSRIVAP